MYRVACLLVLAVCSAAAAAEYRVTHAVAIAPEPACMPAATRVPGGDILVAYSTVWEPYPPGGTLTLVRSTDNGRTWSEPRVLWKPTGPLDGIHLGCGMTTLRDGTILLPCTYNTVQKRKQIKAGEKRPSRIYGMWNHRNKRETFLFTSKDSGRTWQKKKIHTSPRRHWLTTFGRIIEMPNGDILAAAYWGRYNPEQDGNEWRAHGFLRSRDRGQTWQRVEMPQPWNSEISPALLADGTLLTILRNNGRDGWPRRIFGRSCSTDGGRTWSKPTPTGVRGKMPDLRVLPSGRILMGVGAEGLLDGSLIFTRKDRYSFCTLFISDDEGKSWKKDIPFAQAKTGSTIVPSDSPCLVPLDDDKVFVVLQALDRTKENDPLVGYSAGMSLIGNVIEPIKR